MPGAPPPAAAHDPAATRPQASGGVAERACADARAAPTQERMRREIIGLGGSETEKTDGNPFLTAIIGGGLIIVLGALVTGTL